MAMLDGPPALPPWLARQLPWRRGVVSVGGRRVHVVDDGPREGAPTALLMHGNPTWCYLWRKVVARLLPRGLRVVAPDLVGFGLSDKPRSTRAHSLAMHVGVMAELIEALDLRDVVLVGQDWGGPIAIGAGMHHPDRVQGMVLANTAVLPPARPFRSKGFHKLSHAPVVSDVLFRGLGFPLPVLPMAQGDRRSIGLRELRAYAYPLRRVVDRSGPIALARMVADSEEHPSTRVMDEIGAWAQSWSGPAALVWGTRDPILGRALKRHRKALPQATVTETRAGHFLQEEVPDELADAVASVAMGARSTAKAAE